MDKHSERVNLMETFMSKNILWLDTLSIFFPEVIILCLSHVKMKKKKIDGSSKNKSSPS